VATGRSCGTDQPVAEIVPLERPKSRGGSDQGAGPRSAAGEHARRGRAGEQQFESHARQPHAQEIVSIDREQSLGRQQRQTHRRTMRSDQPEPVVAKLHVDVAISPGERAWLLL
jgi:hypothetical protein